MPTLLAPNGISPLQRDLRAAVATKVVDGRAFNGVASLEGVAPRNGDVGGDLVCFTRHGCLYL